MSYSKNDLRDESPPEVDKENTLSREEKADTIGDRDSDEISWKLLKDQKVMFIIHCSFG